MKIRDENFVLVRYAMLPEAIQRTMEAKRLLETGSVDTVQEAVDQVGLSRSSFYKYKNSVFPFSAVVKEKIITISMLLAHRPGVLSGVLAFLAQAGASVLTINQTIPLQGEATVSMSIDTARVNGEHEEVIEQLRKLPGVNRAVIVGTGE